MVDRLTEFSVMPYMYVVLDLALPIQHTVLNWTIGPYKLFLKTHSPTRYPRNGPVGLALRKPNTVTGLFITQINKI